MVNAKSIFTARKLLLTAFAGLALLLLLAGRADAALTFNGSSLAAFESVRGASGTITEVADPLGSGKTVFKTTVANTDVAPASPFANPRADAISPAIVEEGDDFWMQTKMLFPASFPGSIPGEMLLSSIYGPPSAGSPPWQLTTDGEYIAWQRNGTYGWDVPWAVPLEREKWLHIVMHQRFDEAGKGFVEMWLNGERIKFFNPASSWNPNKVAETNHLTMATMDETNDGGPNDAKIVQSRELGAASTATVYFGPLRLGDTRADVAEPTFNGTTKGAFSKIESCPERVTEVADPLGSGETVFSVKVNDTDGSPCTSTKHPRAQMYGPANVEKGDDFWLRTKFLLPTGFPAIPEWLTLVTVYGPPSNGPAPWNLAVDNEELLWQRNGTYGYDIPWGVPVERGKWTTLLLHERFDEAGKGFIEMWIDGQRIKFFNPATSWNPGKVAETNHLTMATVDESNGGAANSVRIGQYRAFGMFETGTLYFGPLRVGENRGDVDF